MPELPEVETTRLGILPHLHKKSVRNVLIRQSQLRWPIPHDLKNKLCDQLIEKIERRGKYLLLSTTSGTLILHLGMSGRLRIIPTLIQADKHDHVDFVLDGGACLRYTDPRRFGAILWTENDPYKHPLLKNLGPEPLTKKFDANYLFEKSRNRTLSIKEFIMDNKVVVGVGNIYANEALFATRIKPTRSAKKITLLEATELTSAIKKILKRAIRAGGTTLRDYYSAEGAPGFFQQKLSVYGRDGLACLICEKTIRQLTIGQRSSFYCPNCQK